MTKINGEQLDKRLSEMEREFDELDKILALEKSCSKYQFLKRRKYRIEYAKRAIVVNKKWKLFKQDVVKWST